MPGERGQPQAFLYTSNGASPFGPCVSCHSISSNGSIMIAQQHFYPSSDPLNGEGSMSLGLTKTAKPDVLAGRFPCGLHRRAGPRRGRRRSHPDRDGLRLRHEDVLEGPAGLSRHTNYPGWPFFTPDNKSVIFALGNTKRFGTEEPPLPARACSSQLYIVLAAGGTAHRLDSLGGLDPSGNDYLPWPKDDYNLDFYPTVSPISAGSYFWVYFTSRRSYGNLCAKGSGDVGSKSIWVSAIDIDAPAGTEPSHPAFYLPGQELGSGNHSNRCRSRTSRPLPRREPATANALRWHVRDGQVRPAPGVRRRKRQCTPTVPCCLARDVCIGGYCGVAPPK